MFRILGLLVKKDCAACAKKVLKECNLYLFCRDYAENTQNPHCLLKQQDSDNITLINPYKIEGSDIAITVNAIVGKNGDGKSSLVELILRILNNFAFTYGFQFDQKTLGYNKSVDATLYYEIDGDQYAIECNKGDQEYAIGKDDYNVRWYENGEIIHNPITTSLSDDRQRKLSLAKHHIHDLFYTLTINYSLYAYNSKILGRESDYNNWIDGLFYKNDAYQTPIGITPFRDKGNIDINKEEYLSQQRLMSLYVIAGPDEKKRIINEDKKAVGFAFTMESESKLVSSTILEYFDNIHEVESEWYGTNRINGGFEELKKNRNRQKEKEVESRLKTFCNAFFKFINWCNDSIFNNSAFEEIVGNYLTDYKHLEKTDFRKAIESVDKTITFFGISEEQLRFKLKALLESNWSKLNYAQLYRLILVDQVWRYLNDTKRVDIHYCDLQEALHNRRDPIYAAKLYSCYKIIEICNTYFPYYNHGYLEDQKYELIDEYASEAVFFQILHKDIDEILAKDDYTTLKLRQTIHYIAREAGLFDANDDVINDLKCKYVTFDSLFHQFSQDGISMTAKQVIQFLPPPIFVGYIVIQSNDGEKFFISELSSGELQRLYSVGSFLYHLRNLDCEQKGEGMIQYENILVIMEEVELYFHPEYQITYISYLFEQIKMLQLGNIKSINLLFVTHSPFILTDILKQNVLCIEKGKVKNENVFHTFGANVYDILKESFFLKKGAIGTISQKFISKIVDELKNMQESSCDKDILYDKIMLIDEPIVRHLLMDKYKHIFKQFDKEKQIKYLQKQIEDLEKS